MVFKVFVAYTVVAAVIAIRYGYVAATKSDGRPKVRARFIASLAFCSWIGLSPALWILYDRTRPIFEAQGTIESIQVLDGSSQRYSANVRVRVAEGAEVQIHVSDRSAFLHPGEQLKVRYRGDTGELMNATFYAPNGQKEGVLNSTRLLSQLAMLLVAMVCMWASIRKYRRDWQEVES